MQENHEGVILSKRLQTVASLVEPGSILLDIGTDHAYLPINLYHQKKIDHAYAGEVVKGPYENALENIKKYQAENTIELFLGTGFSVVEQIDNPEQIDVITICGMGGQLITDIIQEGMNKNQIPADAELILQPNNQESVLREKLIQLGYDIVAEEIIKEQAFYYEIIKAAPVSSAINYSEEELFFGPILLEEKSDTFVDKWKERMTHYEKIANNLEQAKQPPVDKIKEVNSAINKIKKVIQ